MPTARQSPPGASRVPATRGQARPGHRGPSPSEPRSVQCPKHGQWPLLRDGACVVRSVTLTQLRRSTGCMTHLTRRQSFLAALLLTAVAASACDGAPAQVEATQPKPPTNGAVAYDAERKLVVLMTPGPGQQLSGALQTWTWDGRVWSRKAPVVRPPARCSALVG